MGLQGAGQPFDLKTGQVGGQVGGQEDLRKLESRIERFVSRSSGSECRCENEFHFDNQNSERKWLTYDAFQRG